MVAERDILTGQRTEKVFQKRESWQAMEKEAVTDQETAQETGPRTVLLDFLLSYQIENGWQKMGSSPAGSSTGMRCPDSGSPAEATLTTVSESSCWEIVTSATV